MNFGNMENHLAYATNNYSNQYEYRFELNSVSHTCLEARDLKMREENLSMINLRDPLVRAHYFPTNKHFLPIPISIMLIIMRKSLSSHHHSMDIITWNNLPCVIQQVRPLSNSSIFNHYNSIYDGARIYPCLESRNHFDQDSGLMKYQRKCSEKLR